MNNSFDWALNVFNFESVDESEVDSLSETEINSRYRELVKEKHPDSGGSTEEFVELQEARDILLTGEAREAEDTGSPDQNDSSTTSTSSTDEDDFEAYSRRENTYNTTKDREKTTLFSRIQYGIDRLQIPVALYFLLIVSGLYMYNNSITSSESILLLSSIYFVIALVGFGYILLTNTVKIGIAIASVVVISPLPHVVVSDPSNFGIIISFQYTVGLILLSMYKSI